jgi:uncharacterized lipoprotein YajG
MRLTRVILTLAGLALLAACSAPTAATSRSDGPRYLLQLEMSRSVMVSL